MNGTEWRRWAKSGWWLSLMLAALIGCSRRSETETHHASDSTSETARPARLTPDDVLRKMIAAYREADSYRDDGVFRVVLERGGEQTPDSAPLAVAWARPNRIAIRAYRAVVACDGRQFTAKIIDEASGDLDSQVVVRPAPTRLTLDDIFSDAVLRESLGGRLGLHPMQLELLLAEAPLSAFIDPNVAKKLLAPREFDGRPCLRVEANLEGRYVFWIDREAFILRRLEYPSDALLAAEEAEDVDLSIAAEFRGATFKGEIPPEGFTLEAFDVAIPEDARQVRFFVIPPAPLPTEMFGKRPEGYEFITLDGERITAESLEGKIAVLAWFSNHPGSRECLESLEAVRKQLPEDTPIVIYGVCTEPSSMSNDEVRRLAESWGVTMPIIRDLGAYGRDVFDIRVAPSLVVLDTKGVVQIHESAANPQLAALVKEQLAELLQRLSAGEDFAAAILTQARNEQEAYELNLQAAMQGDVAADLQPAEIAPQSEPQHLKLSPQWTNDALSQPGNVLAVDDGGAPRLLVLDGWRTVVELDAEGQIQSRHELDLPEGAAVSYLRTAADAEGNRYYAACSLLAPQVHVFDDAWRRVFSYPTVEEEHEGIRDVLLAKLDDQRPMLAVGFGGVVGVHGVDLEGQRQWSNRDLTPVFSLAATPPDAAGWRKLLVAGQPGHILRVNQFGNADPSLHVRQRQIHHLIAADWPADRQTLYLGLSNTPDGSLLAIGLSAGFEEMWSYRLPPGAHRHPVQVASAVRLVDTPGGQWLLAGPDGSVHLISDDGEFFDYFQTGQALHGLAAARDMLFLSTEEGVVASRASREP
ncbi:MAG: hypothetical protein KY475_14355 [Planctomycetes bacterium]|nr:hypothetical protein [Planctomycetota bacterium]